MRRHESGLATVEFAIVGALFFVVIFGVIELGRGLFILNALTEGTRRGARVAAVCPVGDPRPAQVAIFANADGVSRYSRSLTTANVEVRYLDANGAVVADIVANFLAIQYVRVRIVNYTQQLMIPFIRPSFLSPPFTATLPRESLGYSPTAQAFLPCLPVGPV